MMYNPSLGSSEYSATIFKRPQCGEHIGVL